jgi:hypothetical protein
MAEVEENSDVSSATKLSSHYCSISEAMKLITYPFDGDKSRLREFIENVDVVSELVSPRQHDVL